MDLFFIFDLTFLIMVDECIRWCITAPLVDKTAATLLRAVFDSWIQYFGPMLVIAFDQEGGITSEMCSVMCEKFCITRDLGGSQGHGGAPVAERRLAIVKLAALKCKRSIAAQGYDVTDAMLVQECAMVTNHTLVYNGVTPAQALTGSQPRELYDLSLIHI